MADESSAVIPRPTAHSLLIPVPIVEAFTALAAGLSTGSQRQYRHTFTGWAAWCDQHGLSTTALSRSNVLTYLGGLNVARSTAQARLVHLRAVANALHTADITCREWEQNARQLEHTKLGVDWQPAVATDRTPKRAGEYLDAARVHELLAAWPVTRAAAGESVPYLRGLRNRALLAVLFYAGLRRFEVAKLRWAEVDFDRELIGVIGGKARERDEVDYVPFLGSIERYLRDWFTAQQAAAPGREYVFCRVLKGDHLGDDMPITPDGLYKQVAADFPPHSARRTLISDLLRQGSYIGDVRVISRHASEATLLRYAKAHGAEIAGRRVKLGY